MSSLPNLQNEINSQLLTQNQQRKKLGENSPRTKDQLINLVGRFSGSYRSLIDGDHREFANCGEKSEITGGARICHIFHSEFLSSLNSLNPLNGLGDQNILTAVRNSTVISFVANNFKEKKLKLNRIKYCIRKYSLNIVTIFLKGI